ncbi:hypothetical protein SAMN05444920_110240 [Nonomuraea solani]|uniref:Uncharacterized protein n=1 Tax=Nonomuraea solani TaxID=1144553 RepID=A0A1H6EJ29_9ACTN|nr:hypothetical protein [Nonomuraea solani]SEG97161.1 hypothetical protein SAMN05444920_110240 [Nonomuraea solani]
MIEYLIQVSHERLSSGLVLDAPADTDDFLVVLGDETEARAQLLSDHTGRPLLRMGGYMTGNGSVVDECVWTVTETTRQGDRVRLRLGDALP